jgi:hypothetical protein
MTNEQITPAQEYITKDAISYSALSRLADGPQAYLNKSKPTGDFLSKGSAVDILLTEPDNFHDMFYIMTDSKPSTEGMLAYTMSMIENDNHEIALAASGYKKPVSMAKWEEIGKPYYDAIKASAGKIVLSFDDYQQVQGVVNQLKTNQYTKTYFADNASDVKYDEIQYQFIHYFDYKQTACKVKLDVVTIDHQNKKIKGLDLKTTGKPVFSFRSSYRNFKYYLQAALFKLGLEDWRDKNYPEYEVEDFEFIVAEMACYNPPLIFKIPKEQTNIAIFGGETSSGYYIKGVEDLLADLAYYNENDAWEYPAEVHKNNGVVELDLFK